MKYQIIFYLGLAGTLVTFIITIVAFFKCNVVENMKDLFGGRLKFASNKNKKNVKNEKDIAIRKYSENKTDGKGQGKENSRKCEETKSTRLSGNLEVTKEVRDSEITNPIDNVSDMFDKSSGEVLNNHADQIQLSDKVDEFSGESTPEATELLEEGAEVTELLEEASEETELLEQIDDDGTTLLDMEDEDNGFSEFLCKEIDICVTHINCEDII